MGTIPISNLVPGAGAAEVLSYPGAPVAGVSEVQLITITGTPTGGTFTLSGVNPNNATTFTTAPIAYNASAATVVAALVAVLGTGAVTGSGGALPGSAVSATFAGAFTAKNIPQMTADGTLLTGGTSPAVAVTTTTQGSSATYAGKAAAGVLLVNTVAKALYQNTGTVAAPVWTLNS
ncbi:hypothetical protein IAD21_00894 [Abditibacteriota bacterium]|nr:hypothetical protein IAD21_00894 [Abditibacteriota bacterium]